MEQLIKNSLLDAQECLRLFLEDPSNLASIARFTGAMVKCFQMGGKVMSCGNGGSMCDAMHFAEELSARFRLDRPGLPALAISDASHITCAANDYGFETIFSRYIESIGRSGDILLALSTSGNSLNVIRAAQSARQKNMLVLALLGKDGGKLRELADDYLIAPGKTSDRIQEIHGKIIHISIEMIERASFPHLYK